MSEAMSEWCVVSGIPFFIVATGSFQPFGWSGERRPHARPDGFWKPGRIPHIKALISQIHGEYILLEKYVVWCFVDEISYIHGYAMFCDIGHGLLSFWDFSFDHQSFVGISSQWGPWFGLRSQIRGQSDRCRAVYSVPSWTHRHF